MFESFARKRIKTSGAEIELVQGGAGSPMLLLQWISAKPRHLAQGRTAPGAGFYARDSRPARLWRQQQAAD
jgi:hypothetical protein